MHRKLTWRRRRATGERGAIAVITAISLLALLIASAMVLDFGLIRVDRQVNKSGADAAVVAGLNGLVNGDNNPYPYRGVCQALTYLQSNGPRFANVTAASGIWTNGVGTTTANGCTDATYRAQKCLPGTASSWARFTWNGTYQGTAFKVVIQSGYDLATSGFKEETLPATTADQDDHQQGCDTLAVTITENRKPGVGSLATNADLVSTIRSVGRVVSKPIGDAPAMLLLKQSGCPILSTGSNGGGSYIRVYGAISSSGYSQPGTIHADTSGAGCSGSIFEGKSANGIVAYAAPLTSNPATADPQRPGVISSVAGSNSVALGTIRDAAANVYGSAAINETTAGAAAKIEPSGRGLVTRSIIDSRYLGLATSPQVGVKGAVLNAQSNVFSKSVNSAATATAAGFDVYIDNCSPTAADLSAVTVNSKVWINCTANSGFTGTAPIIARTVVFSGSVKPPNSAAGVALPNAEKVYIFGDPTKDAISLSTGSVFSMHTTSNMNGSLCSTSQSTNKAMLFIKAGQIKQTGGTLRLCYTTVVAMGNSATGCLPTAEGTAPTQSPCGASSMGDGQLSQNGGDVDWTAPNQYDQMTDANGDPLPFAQAAWLSVDGPEDLAFWSESAGNSSSATYNMAGQGVLHTVGVYMVPNADPFTISGGATQNLVNAQYIATSIALNGQNTAITMRVDANSAVTLPKLTVVGLVR